MGRVEEEIIRSYLPQGLGYEKAYEQGSKFNAMVRAFATAQEYLRDISKQFIDGQFIQNSSIFLSEHMSEVGIPDDVFYLTNKTIKYDDDKNIFGRKEVEENAVDVYVKRFMIRRGFIGDNLVEIGKLYGINLEVYNGHQILEELKNRNKFPLKIPFKFVPREVTEKLDSEYFLTRKVMYVLFDPSDIDTDWLPDMLPYRLGSGRKIEKIKKLFNMMKRPDSRIDYRTNASTTLDNILDELIDEFSKTIEEGGV